MEYLVLPGEQAFTTSAACKVKDLINKSGNVKVEDVSAVWLHYAHLRQTNHDTARVSNPQVPHTLRCSTFCSAIPRFALQNS
jgi:hypothetical protein